jgi:glycosyltransferase involved in cell wall biosynthesis
MKILHILSSLDPQGGGPMEGVRQMGLYLNSLNHQVEVATLDAADAPWIADFPLKTHCLGPSRTSYRYSSRVVPWLKANAASYDAVVVNGLWQYHGFATWRVLHKSKQPYYVYTHGMNDPWFKRQYPLKHLKKWLYWPWAEYRLLRDAAAVIFTCEEERRLSRESFWLYSCKEAVTSYGTKTPPQDAEPLRQLFLNKFPHLKDKRIALFLSRIHEKKGCDLLVQAFAKVAHSHPELHLVIAGPDKTGLVPHLQSMAQNLGISERITWPGMLQGDLKWGAFYASEVFVLPSHQENFGIAVAEALGCGMPVLISNKVNIWREIKDDGAGFVEDDTLLGTTSLFQAWLNLTPTGMAQLRQQARQTFARRYTVEAMGNRLLEIFREFTGDRTRQ